MNMMTTMGLHPSELPGNAEVRRRLRFWRMIALFERNEIEDAIEAMLGYLDSRGGDPDREATGAEDDFADHGNWGPGCPIADQDQGGDEGFSAADPSWTEWQTRGRHKVDVLGAEIVGRDRFGNMLLEDDEDDDPREGNGDELDTGNAEDDHGFVGTITGWSAQRATPGGSGPGCPISDPGIADRGALGEDDEPEHEGLNGDEEDYSA